MVNVKQKLIETFGVCIPKNAESLDVKKLFMKSGITVIAALAGEGKTTKMLEQSKKWESEGYSVSYVNFDSSANYNYSLIDCPTTNDQIKQMCSIIEQYATENDIVVIDSLKSMASYYGMTIENNDEMYLVMLELRTIIKKTNCSIVLVHHTFRPKNLKSFVDSFYGARAIEEQCDSGFMFYKTYVVIVKSRLGYLRDERVSL
jgi:predicted metallo-beta-lactamase superfamily hydrolase